MFLSQVAAQGRSRRETNRRRRRRHRRRTTRAAAVTAAVTAASPCLDRWLPTCSLLAAAAAAGKLCHHPHPLPGPILLPTPSSAFFSNPSNPSHPSLQSPCPPPSANPQNLPTPDPSPQSRRSPQFSGFPDRHLHQIPIPFRQHLQRFPSPPLTIACKTPHHDLTSPDFPTNNRRPSQPQLPCS